MTKREQIGKWAEATKRYAQQCAERGDWYSAGRFAGEAVELELLAEAVDPNEEAQPWPTCA